jgi:hypothetical protein
MPGQLTRRSSCSPGLAHAALDLIGTLGGIAENEAVAKRS